MANREQVATLIKGVEAWNIWRATETTAPDLSWADFFSGKDLSNANLRATDLRGVKFNGSNLSGASLREANLQGVDLSVAQRGLQTEQLAGADLTGATLPPELTKLYESLENVNNISESARKLFLAVLAACLYSWLTIATTTDVGLITNRASSPLPIIQTSIPIVGFYWVAPLLLLCVYFYFHFYLQKLWEELGSLPAIFPDGRPLHAKIDPWLLNDLVRAHLPKLNINRPFLSYLQLWISVVLAWWVVPITMFLFWGRYLPRHERTGTTFHVALLVISLTTALRLYWLAVTTLRGTERKPFRWKELLTSRVEYRAAACAVVVGVLFGVVSWGARWGVPSNAPIFGIYPRCIMPGAWSKGYLTWVPRLMGLVGYSPFADVRGAEISQKRPNWSKDDKDLDSVVGAQLAGANLRYAWAPGAFLAGANLYNADLSGAYLYGADLVGADMHETRLNEAAFDEADLRNADMRGADMRGAFFDDADLRLACVLSADLSGVFFDGTDLRGADMRDADFSGVVFIGGTDVAYSVLATAKHLDPKAVRGARNREKAFYPDETLRALGLPADHNDALFAEQEKEREYQQKQGAGQEACRLGPPKRKRQN
jgi:uncharacterized protein YjbI with pentapeptide repeats